MTKMDQLIEALNRLATALEAANGQGAGGAIQSHRISYYYQGGGAADPHAGLYGCGGGGGISSPPLKGGNIWAGGGSGHPCD